jgi:hypothetical protein
MTQVRKLMVIFLSIIIIILVLYIFLKINLKYREVHQFVQKHDSFDDSFNKISAFEKERYEQEIKDIDKDEQRLFDDVVTLFINEKVHVSEKIKAVQIQDHVLRKMPLQTKAFIQRNDAEDWSIFWAFANQSLEYYVNRYGVFITHVDREGNEHKATYLHANHKMNMFGPK